MKPKKPYREVKRELMILLSQSQSHFHLKQDLNQKAPRWKN